MEKVLLVIVKLESEEDSWPIEDIVSELNELALSSQAEAADNIITVRDKPTPNFFIGKGKSEEIAVLCDEQNIDTVIFSHDLSGTQQRNLEEVIGRKTIDRTQLILDIFAKHAKSPEGKMQVELAQLQYLMPRLVGKGIILSRLGGGIGTRGPGEQKLEVDRRRIRRRIDKLKSDLGHIVLHRKTLRKKREENALPLVSLVGYTNAGKSTLINSLTGSTQYVADNLFTTLDSISKSLHLPNGENIIISDTVGFLQNLPHHLIEAFKATLEEVKQADLLVHVLDVSHPRVYEHAQAVMKVLKELDAEKNPLVTVLNKIDLLDDPVWINCISNDFPNCVAISAKLKQNIEELLKRIEAQFQDKMALIKVTLPHSRMDLIDLFYREGKVNKIEYLNTGIKINVSLPKVIIDKHLKGLFPYSVIP